MSSPLTLTSNELYKIYDFGLEIAKLAGAKIKEGFYATELPITAKDDLCDLVTFYDQEVERIIKNKLKEVFPEHRFVGEETDASGENWTLTDEPTWVIDPIDGTTNFIHGFPFVCVSIAFLLNQEAVIGIVYNPILDQLYTARKGQGSYLNHTQKLPLRNPTSRPLDHLGQALVMLEFGGQRDLPIMQAKTDSFYSLSAMAPAGGHCRGARFLGTAALDLCMVAQGSADLYWERGPHIWDFAAGVLIVNEAGGLAMTHYIDSEPKDISLDRARKYQMLERSVLAIRATSKITVDRHDHSKAQVDQEDQKSLDFLKDVMQYLKPVPYPNDGANQ